MSGLPRQADITVFPREYQALSIVVKLNDKARDMPSKLNVASSSLVARFEVKTKPHAT
jgi:hypothetical protein